MEPKFSLDINTPTSVLNLIGQTIGRYRIIDVFLEDGEDLHVITDGLENDVTGELTSFDFTWRLSQSHDNPSAKHYFDKYGYDHVRPMYLLTIVADADGAISELGEDDLYPLISQEELDDLQLIGGELNREESSQIFYYEVEVCGTPNAEIASPKQKGCCKKIARRTYRYNAHNESEMWQFHFANAEYKEFCEFYDVIKEDIKECHAIN